MASLYSISPQKRSSTAGATALFLALTAGFTPAATFGQQAAPAASAAQGGGDLQEIVVTAEKRSESINDVPMSISAASGPQLMDLGVTDTRDLGKITPGFTFAETQLGIPVYTLRGIGFYDQSLSSTPAVSVYNDEVPLTYPAMARGTVLDLERVEILKGPQGTLFGQNSTGGAINYVAAKPTDTLDYGFNGSIGRFAEFDGGGFVSGPLTDTLRARFAVQTTQREDGWQQSYTHDDTLGRANKTLARMLLDWTPNDALSVRLNVNGWLDKSETQAAQLVGLLPQNPKNVPPALLTYPFAPNNDRAADWADVFPGHPHRDERFYQTSLRVEYKLPADMTLTSLSAYSNLAGESSFDADGLSYPAYNYFNDTNVKSYFQELRLSGSSAVTQWVVGSNYEHDATHQSSPFNAGFASLNPTDGYNITSAGERQDTRTDTYAAFANLEYTIVPDVTLQGGVRYTRTDEDATGCGFIGTQSLADLFNFLSTTLNGGTAKPNAYLNGCYTLGPAPSFLPGPVSNSIDESNVSWRTGVKWNVDKDTLVYANISRGYKNGGIPAVSATVSTSLTPYKQEDVLAYETGFKTTLADRRVQLNGAAFYYDYSNKQILGNYSDPIFGIQPLIVNIPKSSIVGVEAAISVTPVDGLHLSLAGAYLHSKINSYTGYDTLGAYGSYAGTSIPFTPEFTANGDAEYDWPMGSMTDFVGAGLTYNSRTNAGIGDIPALNIDAYALLDLRAGVRKDHWTFTAYGRNVTNEYYWTTTLHVQDSLIRYAGMPATFGVEFSYRH
jgi:iron complex outermembrane recepter protein